MKDDYLNILSRFDKTRLQKSEFMKNNIPCLDSYESLEAWDDLFHLIKEESYPKDAIIVEENQPGDFIFFIASGQCTIEKQFTVCRKKDHDDHEYIEVEKVISTLEAGTCFGEEILTSRQFTYKYTIKVILEFLFKPIYVDR